MVIAAFLPIIAIVAMGPAVPGMIEHFANDPDARAKVPAMIGAPGLTMAFLAPFAGCWSTGSGAGRCCCFRRCCTAVWLRAVAAR